MKDSIILKTNTSVEPIGFREYINELIKKEKKEKMSNLVNVFEIHGLRTFRVNYEDCFYDISIPDIDDVSSIVNITDMYGVQVPFTEWEKFEKILEDYITKNFL